MKNKKVKGFFIKKSESFSSGSLAKARTNTLRLNEHISHVVRDKSKISYSIQREYYDECVKLDISW